jgi:hypothetical protein
MRHLFRAIVLACLGSLAFLTSPADACGCGAYIPRDGSASVSQERVVLRWDGKTEDIVMSLGILGQSQDAAVILPVPSRAELKLGDARIFDELAEFTKPKVEERRVPARLMLGAGAMPGGAAVTVLERKQLGPFDVSNLAANDANALGEWLKANGYYQNFSPRLARALQPYTEQGWNFVAVRVRPGMSGDALKGNLDPLWATFATEKLVYPMRASANATNRQTVTLYVLADHRVTKTKAFGDSQVTFAGWIEPTALKADSVLKPFVTRKWFLTKFEDAVNPDQVNDDFFFTTAPTDEAYRAVKIVEIEDANLLWLNLAAIFCVVIGAPLGFLALIVLLIIYFLRRRQRARPQTT